MNRWVLWGVLGLILGLAVLTYVAMRDVGRRAEDVMDSLTIPMPDRTARTKDGRPMLELEVTWTSNGKQIRVHAVQNEGESAEDFVARFNAAVALMEAAYPPD